MLDGLASLVDKSLVRQEQHGGGERARSCWRRSASSRWSGWRRARTRTRCERGTPLHFLALAEEAGAAPAARERRAWLARLEHEHDNLRAAFDFCAGSGADRRGAAPGGALWRFWQFRGHLREGSHACVASSTTLRRTRHPAEREGALEAAGGLSYWLADWPTTTAAYDEALVIARASGDAKRISNALYNLVVSVVLAQVDERFAARARGHRRRYRRGADARAAGGRPRRDRTLPGGRGRTSSTTYARTFRPHWWRSQESIRLSREIGDHFGLAWALHGRGPRAPQDRRPGRRARGVRRAGRAARRSA